MTDYTTLPAVKDALDDAGMMGTTHDTRLAALITAASRAIDRWCKRPDNGFVGTAETRVYDVPDNLAQAGTFVRDVALLPDTYPGSAWGTTVTEVPIDPLLSVTQVATDADGDGVFETVWATTDYDLLPVNAALDGMPYRRIRSLPTGSQEFVAGVRTLQIQGTFGEALTVPSLVQEACILLVSRWFKRRQAPFGVTEDMGGGSSRLPPMDPDVQMMLERGGFVEKWYIV